MRDPETGIVATAVETITEPTGKCCLLHAWFTMAIGNIVFSVTQGRALSEAYYVLEISGGGVQELLSDL